MKKILFLALTLLLCGSNHAQHLKFLGLELDGDMDSFVTSLKAKGFVDENIDNNITTLEGTFAGERVMVAVVGTIKTKTVWKVRVMFLKKYNDWYDIKNDFNKWGESLTTKYGKPSNSFSFFVKPYYEGDGYEMTAIRVGKCKYAKFFEIDEGVISLDILTSKNISIDYEDKINSEIMQSEKQNNVQEDL